MLSGEVWIEFRIVFFDSLNGCIFVDEVAHVVVSPEKLAMLASLVRAHIPFEFSLL